MREPSYHTGRAQLKWGPEKWLLGAAPGLWILYLTPLPETFLIGKVLKSLIKLPFPAPLPKTLLGWSTRTSVHSISNVAAP